MSNLREFRYTENEGDIVIITYNVIGEYEFKAYQKRADALHDLYNIWVCHYVLIFCSDDELLKEHQEEIKTARRYEP